MRRNIKRGYPRGEETKARILDFAIDLFGTKGFDGVTTRDIAVAASVPTASLRYYFTNKEGLYIACQEKIQEITFNRMEPALEAAESLLGSDDLDLERLIASFCDLQGALVDSMIGGPDGGALALFVVRHDLPTKSGAGKLAGYSAPSRRMMDCFIKMTIRICGDQMDEQSAARVAGLINGQLINIYVRRNRLAESGWEITPERLQWLKRTILMHSAAMLQAHRAEHALVDRAAAAA